MAFCLTAPSHSINKCWLISGELLWRSSDSNFTGKVHDIYPLHKFEYYQFTTTVAFPRDQWGQVFRLMYHDDWLSFDIYQVSSRIPSVRNDSNIASYTFYRGWVWNTWPTATSLPKWNTLWTSIWQRHTIQWYHTTTSLVDPCIFGKYALFFNHM